jgi:hypothetical protein
MEQESVKWPLSDIFGWHRMKMGRNPLKGVSLSRMSESGLDYAKSSIRDGEAL